VRLLVAIWLPVMVIATFNASFPPPAFRSASTWLLHGMFALAVWHLATSDRNFEYTFDRFARVLPGITGLAGLVSMGVIYSIGLSSDYPFGNDIPGFSNIRHSGYIFAPSIALCLGRLATMTHQLRTTVLLLVLNIALCLWFGSRGPFLGLIVGLVVAWILFHEFRHWVFWMRSLFAAITGAILSVIVPSPDDPTFNALRRFFFGGSADLEGFTSGRTEVWKDAIRLIADRPLFGYGGEQFQYVSPAAINIFRHPHDFLLQAIFDWGAIGGGAFLMLLAFGVGSAVKSHQNMTAAGRIALFGAACMLGYATVDGILFYSFTIAITSVFLLTALVLSRTAAASEAGPVQVKALGMA
jgi:O-antigen ligase